MSGPQSSDPVLDGQAIRYQFLVATINGDVIGWIGAEYAGLDHLLCSDQPLCFPRFRAFGRAEWRRHSNFKNKVDRVARNGASLAARRTLPSVVAVMKLQHTAGLQRSAHDSWGGNALAAPFVLDQRVKSRRSFISEPLLISSFFPSFLHTSLPNTTRSRNNANLLRTRSH